MTSLTFFAVLVAAYLPLSTASPHLKPRLLVNSDGLLPSYDFVIVGGGVAGLAVGNRLSEDSKNTVLVIEAGDLDQREDFVEIPGMAGGAVGTKYDWNDTFVPSPHVNNRAIPASHGKVVGGSSVLNQMILHRGAASDYDSWESLGNDGWNWDSMLSYFKKTENFSPPTKELVENYGIVYDESAHGVGGHIDTLFSPWTWPIDQYYIDAAEELGINVSSTAYSKGALGVFWNTHTQEPSTQTRHSARKGYWDSASDRPNFHLLPNRQVTKLVTEGKRVVAVEFAASKYAPRETVKVNKEALMAAGAFYTPQIMQLSGIGPSSLLTQFNITPVVDLDVGYGLQDHLLLFMTYNTSLPYSPTAVQSNATLAAEALSEYQKNETGPYSTAFGKVLFFLPTNVWTNATASLYEQALSQDPRDYLDPDTPETAVAAYAAQHAELTKGLASPDSATVELFPAGDGVSVALLHPFSRGTVKIQSADPFEPPLINGGFLSNPLDLAILREGVKFARDLFQTAALSSLDPVETFPGLNFSSDADIETALRNGVMTVYHPTSTCHMGRKDSGGCVDAQLKVYGVENLRVVDAAAHPLVAGAHVMATVYAVAEKAADIILSSY